MRFFLPIFLILFLVPSLIFGGDSASERLREIERELACREPVWKLSAARSAMLSEFQSRIDTLRKAARNPTLPDVSELLTQASELESARALAASLFESEFIGAEARGESLPEVAVAKPGMPGVPLELWPHIIGPNKKEPGVSVAFNHEGWPFFRGQFYKSLRLEYDPPLKSARYHHRDGRLVSGSKYFAQVLPGGGAVCSHGGSVFGAINMLMTTPNDKSFSFLRDLPFYTQISAETFDPPGSGAGIDLEAVQNFEKALGYFDDFFTEGKEFAVDHGVLNLGIGRSAYSNVIAQLARVRPGLFNGIILTSTLNPETIDEDTVALHGQADRGEYVLNVPVLEWINNFCKSKIINWYKHKHPFGSTPTLIILGTEDADGTPASRARRLALFHQIEKNNPHTVKVVVIQGAGHDVFATRDPEILKQVMTVVYRFLHYLPWGRAL